MLAPDGATLKFSTLLPNLGFISAIAADASGNVYATGGSAFGAGGYALKINPGAATISYSVPLIGASGAGISVDDLGQAYITGVAGPGLETVNALYPTSDGLVPFVTKLAPDGGILFSTYLGAGAPYSSAYGTGIALGPAGEIYVAGNSASALNSSYLPVPGGLQTSQEGDLDGFLIKLANDGSQVLYGTYIGSNVVVTGVAVDAQGRAYLAGSSVYYAGPPELPTVNAFQPDFVPGFFVSTSGFAGALTADGSAFDYLTWGIGASANAVAVDPSGGATFVGRQGATEDFPPVYTLPGEFDIPTRNAFQPLPAGDAANVFVVRILPGDAGTLTLRNVPVQAVEGQPFTDVVVAAFTTTGTEQASQFSATIDWGDGTSSPGKIVGDFHGGFRVLGSHLYDEPGSWEVGVTLYDAQGRPLGVSSTDATAAQSGHVHYHVSIDTSSFTGTDGQLSIQFNPGAIPPDAQALISHLQVTGGTLDGLTHDGDVSGTPTAQAVLTPSTALNRLLQNVTFGSRVEFDVELVGSGLSHPAHGSFTEALAVQVLAADGKTSLLASDASNSVLRLDLEPDGTTQTHIASPAVVVGVGGSATVAEAGLSAVLVSFKVQEGQPYSGPVADVTNNNPLDTAADMHAVVDWGDGSLPEDGIITGADGHFVVSGTHTYTSAGHYQLLVDVTERERLVTVRASNPVGGIGAGPAIASTETVATGDFNGDGLPDLVTLLDFSGNAAVELAQADGGFGAPIALPINVPYSYNSTAGVAADFDGDGNLDLAIVQGSYSYPEYSHIQVLFGKGDGTFQIGPVSPTFTYPPTSIAAGDFNGDGYADVVLGVTFSFEVLLGSGDGSFAAQPPKTVNTYVPAIVVADLNNDGRDDLAVTSYPGTNLYFGTSDGSFSDPVLLTAGVTGTTIYGAADVTGDGNLDLVGLSSDGNNAQIFAGRGDGTFADALNEALPFTANALSVGDMNYDHRADILALSSTTGELAVLLSGATGQLRLAYDLPHLGGTIPPRVADFNGDGNLDVLTGVSPHLYYGRGDGTLVTPSPVVASAGQWSPVVSFDVNGDGKDDLVTSVITGVAVQLGHGDGTFDQQAQVPVTDDASWVAAAKLAGYAVGDLNGDGSLDLVRPDPSVFDYSTGYSTPTTVSVLLNNGDGTFATRHVEVGANPVAVVLSDLRGNGILDLVVSLSGEYVQGTGYTNGGVAVALGIGDGTFKTAIRYPAGVAGVNPASFLLTDNSFIAVGDLGNGAQDIIVVSSGQGGYDPLSGRVAPVRDRGLFVLLGSGDGTFTAGPTYLDDPQLSVYAPLSAVALGDFNNDRKLDVVVSVDDESDVKDDVLLLLGNGDGTLGPAMPVDATQFEPSHLAVGDLNHDGNLDLLVMDGFANAGGSPVHVLLGTGLGTFEPQTAYAVGEDVSFSLQNFAPQGMVLGDFNGDGKVDVAVGESGSGAVGNTLTVLLGHGDGTLAAPILSTERYGPPVPLLPGGDEVAVATADLTGDGRTDLIGGGIDGVTVHLRNSDGSYAAPVTYGLNGRVSEIATGDLNRDGRPDIVAVLPDQNAVAVLINNGDGTFTRGADVIAGHGLGSVLLGDFSGDGRLDLTVTLNGDLDFSYRPLSRRRRCGRARQWRRHLRRADAHLGRCLSLGNHRSCPRGRVPRFRRQSRSGGDRHRRGGSKLQPGWRVRAARQWRRDVSGWARVSDRERLLSGRQQ